MKFGNDIYRKISIRNNAEKNNNYNVSYDINSEKEVLNTLEENMIIVNSVWNIDYDFIIHSHRKIIGKFIVLGKKIVRKCLKWYVRDTGIEQNKFNSYSVKSMNGIWDYINILNKTNIDLKDNINKLNDDNINLKGEISKTNNNSSKLKDEINKLYSENKEFKTNIIDIIKINENLTSEIANLKDRISLIEKSYEENLNHMSFMIDKYNEDILYIKYRLKRLTVDKDTYKLINTTNLDSENSKKEDFIKSKIDYFDFENKFRGLEREITKKQEIYLPYFKDANKMILDIGSGRGEFLSMLKQNNILCKGVDSYPEFVNYCKYKGLDVVLDDAVSFLETLEDNSLGGIFIGQVVEHLETSYLIKLFNLCRDKIEKGGKIIAETQNPETLGVLGEAFYIDPSHIKPIHPLQLRYIAESSGFKNIEILYLNEFEEKIPYPIGLENEKEMNEAIDRVNKLLYGPRDYSIIGEK